MASAQASRGASEQQEEEVCGDVDCFQVSCFDEVVQPPSPPNYHPCTPKGADFSLKRGTPGYCFDSDTLRPNSV